MLVLVFGMLKNSRLPVATVIIGVNKLLIFNVSIAISAPEGHKLEQQKITEDQM